LRSIATKGCIFKGVATPDLDTLHGTAVASETLCFDQPEVGEVAGHNLLELAVDGDAALFVHRLHGAVEEGVYQWIDVE